MQTICKIALAVGLVLTPAFAAQAADHEDQSGGIRVGPEGQRFEAPAAQIAPRGEPRETEGRGGAIGPKTSGENPAFDKERLHDNEPQDKGTDEKKK
jgi:hypothetical protein